MSDDEFPKSEWPRLRQAMESGGAEAVIAFVRGFDDALQRRQLYHFAQPAFAHREWDGKNLDGYAAVARAGIAECLVQAESESDPEVAAKRTDLANIMSFNLAAGLADCWEGEEPRPERRHFEAGLRAANDCLRWRRELGKGPHPFSIAHWAKGMHLLSLGDALGAAKDFGTSLERAREHAESEAGRPVESHESFGIALGEGYLAIAQRATGDETATTRFEAACTAFEKMAEDAEKKDDAAFGLGQIRYVWRKYGP